jgi:hypothetical protein
MKRPALLRAFCGQWIAERQSSDFTQAARFAGGGQIYLLLRFFRGLLRQVMQSILAAISSSTLAEKGYHALFRRQWDGWSSETSVRLFLPGISLN